MSDNEKNAGASTRMSRRKLLFEAVEAHAREVGRVRLDREGVALADGAVDLDLVGVAVAVHHVGAVAVVPGEAAARTSAEALCNATASTGSTARLRARAKACSVFCRP